GFGLLEVRALRDHVDDAAESPLTIKDGGRPGEDLDPLDIPGVERKAERAVVREQAHAVEKLENGISAKPARRHRKRAVAGCLRLREAGRATDGVAEFDVAKRADRIAIDRVDAGRSFECSQAEPAARGC